MLLAKCEHKRAERVSIALVLAEVQAVEAQREHDPPPIVHLVEAVDVQRHIDLDVVGQLLKPADELPTRQVNLLDVRVLVVVHGNAIPASANRMPLRADC